MMLATFSLPGTILMNFVKPIELFIKRYKTISMKIQLLVKMSKIDLK